MEVAKKWFSSSHSGEKIEKKKRRRRKAPDGDGDGDHRRTYSEERERSDALDRKLHDIRTLNVDPKERTRGPQLTELWAYINRLYGIPREAQDTVWALFTEFKKL